MIKRYQSFHGYQKKKKKMITIEKRKNKNKQFEMKHYIYYIAKLYFLKKNFENKLSFCVFDEWAGMLEIVENCRFKFEYTLGVKV